PMVSLFKAECEKRGVEPDYRDVPYISEQSALKEFSRQAEFFAGDYKGKPRAYQEILKQAKAEQPTPEIYQQPSGIYHQVRSLLEGDVQRILDCNVEELSALSDKDLRKRREELNKLYAASLNVEKCLPIKHPYQNKLTLKEDLIGQQRLKYEYKSALLRGLFERVNGFTKQGKKRIEAASMRYRNQMTPGTPEFQEFFYSFSGSLLDYYAVPPKFDEVRTEFNELRNLPKKSRKGELAEAVERLGDKQYFSLAYSEEQLRDMGMPPTIKGPLFRNLNNFPLYEAAQTLLTPEQLRRMLINLGAGAGLTHDSEKETRDKAIEKNNAGLDTYRKVLTAQYDMLERKYGNSLEKLTLRELQEHYLDIAKDFADIQEDGMMAERFPGFIRKDNPDDERLLNRINYYGMCGSAAMGIINYIANIAPKDWASDENIQKRISEVVDMIDDSKKARAYLMEKGESFQHPLDWSQKVKNPADGS
ncbi:MAG: hypothetical protein K2J60_08795, partial [Acetatifactor sp.]|nr:hypothetical protein [Acetatifactor sp.]